MEPTFAKELQRYVAKQVNDFRIWLKPDPKDSTSMKILKGLYKSIVVLILIAFSPILAVILTVAFLAAF